MDNENEKSQINQKRYSKTHFAEQAKIHLVCVFKDVVYMCEKGLLEKQFFTKSRDLSPL